MRDVREDVLGRVAAAVLTSCLQPEFDDICEKANVKDVLNCVDKMLVALKAPQASERVAPRVQMQEAIVGLKRQELERLQEELDQVEKEKKATEKSVLDKQEVLLRMADRIADRKAHLEKALSVVEEAGV